MHFVALGKSASDVDRDQKREEEIEAAFQLKNFARSRPCFLVCTPEKVDVSNRTSSNVMKLLRGGVAHSLVRSLESIRGRSTGGIQSRDLCVQTLVTRGA